MKDYLRLGFLLPFVLFWMILTLLISFIYPAFLQTLLLSTIETIEKYNAE